MYIDFLHRVIPAPTNPSPRVNACHSKDVSHSIRLNVHTKIVCVVFIGYYSCSKAVLLIQMSPRGAGQGLY